MVARSLRQRAVQTGLLLVAVAAGAALAAALLAVAFEVRERMAADLRAFGANIRVLPRREPLDVVVGALRYVAPEEAAYIDEADLPRLKGIFWRHNIVALAPFLSGTVEVAGQPALLAGTWFERAVEVPEAAPRAPASEGVSGPWITGVRRLAPSWRVEGAWVADGAGGALVGRALAARIGVAPGETVEVRAGGRSARLPVRGTLHTGGLEEDRLLVELETAQALLGLPGKVDSLEVSALVTPDNPLAVRARTVGPGALSAADYETWYCSPYLDTILFQIEEALPGVRAKAVRQVSDAEAAFLGKLTAIFALVAAVGLAAATLAVGATAARSVFERRREVGLMKALGAESGAVLLLLLAEAALVALAGGALGAIAGGRLARTVGTLVFATPVVPHPALLPAVIAAAAAITLCGVALPLRAALRVEPVVTLREEPR